MSVSSLSSSLKVYSTHFRHMKRGNNHWNREREDVRVLTLRGNRKEKRKKLVFLLNVYSYDVIIDTTITTQDEFSLHFK